MDESADLPGKAPKSFSGLITARRFFDGTASSYDRCVDLWTLGQDRFWKKNILAQIPDRPERAIDQACGTGILTLLMARRFPGCRIVGVDLHREYLSIAFQKAQARGLGNLQWVQGRAEEVVLKGKYDCITSSYLAKYANMESLVRNADQMLKKGGILIMHDFTYPRTRLLSSALEAYFLIMRTVGRHAFPQWGIVFNELEDFLKQSRWIPDLVFSLRKYGFRSIRITPLTLGFAAIITARRQ